MGVSKQKKWATTLVKATYRNGLIGNKVEILTGNNTILNAQVLDIDNTGELIVTDNNANIHRIYSGDVSVKNFST